MGAVAFIGAVIYTVFTSKEYPPTTLEIEERKKEESKGIKNIKSNLFKDLWSISFSNKNHNFLIKP